MSAPSKPPGPTSATSFTSPTKKRATTNSDRKPQSLSQSPHPPMSNDSPNLELHTIIYPRLLPTNSLASDEKAVEKTVKYKRVTLLSMAPTRGTWCSFHKEALRWSEPELWEELCEALKQDELANRGLLVGLEHKKRQRSEEREAVHVMKKTLDYKWVEIRVFETWVNGAERDVLVNTFY